VTATESERPARRERSLESVSMQMNKSQQRTPLRRRAIGVGMVEVLVALVVLSVGLLGVASLFVTTMQAKGSAQSRMQAINLAADIADRIRANRGAGSAYAVADTATLGTPSTNCVDGASAAVVCTAAQMAAHDLYLWSNQVTQMLPGRSPKRSITVDTTTTPTTYTITIKWTEQTSAADGLIHTMKVQI
jgi:type IV pilus assembly protein PilV